MKAIIRRLRSERRAVSNVLVVMLSLILITVIVANVVLWSYQMSQLDWEKAQESVKILNAEPYYLRLENSSLVGTFTERTAGAEQKFYPENCTFLGGTRHVSGGVFDLWSNDGAYMKILSHFDGVTYYFAAKDAAYTVSSNQFSDYISLNFTAENQSAYFVLGYLELKCSSTSQQAQAQFVQGSTILAKYLDRPRNITEVMPHMFAYIYDGTGTNVMFKWQIAASSSGTSVTALKGRIYAIRLDNLPNIEYKRVYESNEQQNMDNIWGDDLGDTFEITVNPQTDGDYLIWASAKVESDSTSSSVSVRLNIDDGFEYIPHLTSESPWSYARIEDTSTSEENSFAIIAIRRLTAGYHSIKFQIADIDSSPSADWQYISLLAIRLTGVFEYYSASTVVQAQTIQTTFQTYTLLNIPSGKAGEYLILSGITVRGLSIDTNHGYETALTIDDLVYEAQQVKPKDIYDYVPKVFVQNITLNNESHIAATKYRTLNPAMTVYVKNSDIIAIRLPRVKQVAKVEFTGNSNPEDWTSLSWTVDGKCTTSDVETTFQLYRTDGYPNSGDGYQYTLIGTNDVTISQTITVNATSFRDPTTGTWKLRINAVKTTSIPFEFWVDFIELKAQSEGKTYSLSLEGDFTLNLTRYPVKNVSSVEINIRLKAGDTGERWILKTYNWTSNRYDIMDTLLPTLYFKDYTIGLENWQSYINPSNGTLKLVLHDETPDGTPTTINVNFFAVKVTLKYGVVFTLKNGGAATAHIVAVWVITEKSHKRYSADFFVNPGERADYLREDISLPVENFIIKVVTERGNVAIFSSG